MRPNAVRKVVNELLSKIKVGTRVTLFMRGVDGFTSNWDSLKSLLDVWGNRLRLFTADGWLQTRTACLFISSKIDPLQCLLQGEINL